MMHGRLMRTTCPSGLLRCYKNRITMLPGEHQRRHLFGAWGRKMSTADQPSADKKANGNGEDAKAEQQNSQKEANQNEQQETSADLKRVQELEVQLKEMKDHYLRALADAENLRERTRREKEQAQHLAIKSFATDLLSVTDILEIALNSVPEEERKNENNPHLKNLYTGLTMTYAELLAAFKRNGLHAFDPVGEAFDPNKHQALFQAPMPDKAPGTVFQVTKKGYTLHQIVIRAAQVGVVQ